MSAMITFDNGRHYYTADELQHFCNVLDEIRSLYPEIDRHMVDNFAQLLDPYMDGEVVFLSVQHIGNRIAETIVQYMDVDVAELVVQHMDSKLAGYSWQQIVREMDDELREEIHTELAPCTDMEFLVAYLRRAADDIVIG